MRWTLRIAVTLMMLTTAGGARAGSQDEVKALNRHRERVFNPDRKDLHWGKRKLKRDS